MGWCAIWPRSVQPSPDQGRCSNGSRCILIGNNDAGSYWSACGHFCNIACPRNFCCIGCTGRHFRDELGTISLPSSVPCCTWCIAHSSWCAVWPRSVQLGPDSSRCSHGSCCFIVSNNDAGSYRSARGHFCDVARPRNSAVLGARAGISATSLAPSVFPQAFRAAPGALRTARGVQFGLDRFSLAQTRAGAPMARAASLSATMMRAPTGVRAGISATLRAPGISAALGARAGISATSLAPSVFPQAFRAAPGALRTARGVDLNLDQFDLSQATKVSSDETFEAPIGNAFWSALDTNSEFEEKYNNLFKAIFDSSISDRRDEGDRFIPPNMSVSYLEKLSNLVKEEELVQ